MASSSTRYSVFALASVRRPATCQSSVQRLNTTECVNSDLEQAAMPNA